MSFWDEQAGAQVPDGGAPTGDFANIPAGKWFLAKNATGNNAAANVATVGRDKQFRVFKCGFIIRGAEEGIDPNLNGRYLFFTGFMNPHEKDNSGAAISSSLVRFFNAVFSAGVGDELLPQDDEKLSNEDKKARALARGAMRWQNTLRVLQAQAEMSGLTIDDFSESANPGGEFICALAAELMQDEYWVCFKTKLGRERTADDGTKSKETEIGAVVDCSHYEIGLHKIVYFDEEDVPMPAGPAPVAEKAF